MSIERKLIGTTDATATEAVYIEDVMATYLYNGTGASQTITNGIDLSTKGGMVWVKSRSAAYSNYLFDTARGVTKRLSSDLTDAEQTGTAHFSAFNTDGFTLGTNFNVNSSSATFTSFAFRKQAKFFDVVTYTGDGTSNRSIAHSLGSVPGMIIVKRTDSTGNWVTYHRSFNENLYLNSTGGAGTIGGLFQISGNSTSTNIVLGANGSETNISGATYVAYLFAHDAGGFGAAGTDSVVACGSYTGTVANPVINLGWEPQFILRKRTDTSAAWDIVDNMRGMPVGAVGQALQPNTSSAESSSQYLYPRATGFEDANSTNGANYIYLAIRRGPMRTPTDATKVFAPVASSAASGTPITVGFPVDMQMASFRDGDGSNTSLVDRLRGVSSSSTAKNGPSLVTSLTIAESAGFPTANWNNTGYNKDSYNYNIHWNFRRAPGFFDVVCFSHPTTIVNHNLGVKPELIIEKRRNTGSNSSWFVMNGTKTWELNFNDAGFNQSVSMTATTYTSPNPLSGSTHVAYLFATCPGVSKVGSYTGNGSSQTIDCGFASGARFVLIKRTDSTGDWYVWDVARGIVSGNDPRLSLNTTAAEVTTDDSIDPASSGFIVNQLSATNINVSGASYVFLSVA